MSTCTLRSMFLDNRDDKEGNLICGKVECLLVSMVSHQVGFVLFYGGVPDSCVMHTDNSII